jgi:capsular exopolysaccharide synthesis family protein
MFSPVSASNRSISRLVSIVIHPLAETDSRLLLVTSVAPGDGKTVTSLNTAIAASRDGRQVTLVDADSRMEGLAKLCGIQPQTVLTNLTSDAVPFEWAVAAHDLFGANVQLMPLGLEVDDPAGFFRSHRFRRALERVRERGDLVIVDTPPLLVVSEAAAIAAQADGIVLVISQGASRRILEEARARLDLVGTPLLGYVYTRSKPGSTRGYEGYLYGPAAVSASKGNGQDAPAAGRLRSESSR